jgi:hypothetical protein
LKSFAADVVSDPKIATETDEYGINTIKYTAYWQGRMTGFAINRFPFDTNIDDQVETLKTMNAIGDGDSDRECFAEQFVTCDGHSAANVSFPSNIKEGRFYTKIRMFMVDSRTIYRIILVVDTNTISHKTLRAESGGSLRKALRLCLRQQHHLP